MGRPPKEVVEEFTAILDLMEEDVGKGIAEHLATLETEEDVEVEE